MWTWWHNFKFGLKPSVRYALITRIPEDDDGNCADEFLSYKEYVTGFGPNGDTKEKLLHISNEYDPSCQRARLPVFELGEILLVNKYGREIAGKGRKPGKWFVDCEYFWTLRGVMKRFQELVKEKRGL